MMSDQWIGGNVGGNDLAEFGVCDAMIFDWLNPSESWKAVINEPGLSSEIGTKDIPKVMQ